MIETLASPGISTSTLEQETGIPISSLKFFPHGIDRIIPYRTQGSLYEEVCFNSLNENLNTGFAIGPHLVDKMLGGKGYGTGGLVRPDGILLETIDEKVRLKTYYEFKSGNAERSDKSIPNKIEGFIVLTKMLQANPRLLPQMIKNVIGEYFFIPDEIEIPNNINVVFYTPDERKPLDGVPYVKFKTRQLPTIYRNSANIYN